MNISVHFLARYFLLLLTLTLFNFSSSCTSSHPKKVVAPQGKVATVQKITVAACNATDVKSAINPKNTKFKKQMDSCATNSLGSAEGTAACLRKIYPALSAGCAGCFGEMAACSAHECTGVCLFNHMSPKCIDCAVKNCRRTQEDGGFSLVTCTGLKNNQLPAK